MTITEAREIIARSDNGHGLDGLEMAAFNTARGFEDGYTLREKELMGKMEEFYTAVKVAVGRLDFEAKDAMMRGDRAWLAEVQPIRDLLGKALSRWRDLKGE